MPSKQRPADPSAEAHSRAKQIREKSSADGHSHSEEPSRNIELRRRQQPATISMTFVTKGTRGRPSGRTRRFPTPKARTRRRLRGYMEETREASERPGRTEGICNP